MLKSNPTEKRFRLRSNPRCVVLGGTSISVVKTKKRFSYRYPSILYLYSFATTYRKIGKSSLEARKQKIGREEENRPDIRSFWVVSVGLADGKTNQNPLIPLCYNLACICIAWRYRLGVRTEDSQSSNPGSIPGSATIPAAITYTFTHRCGQLLISTLDHLPGFASLGRPQR